MSEFCQTAGLAGVVPLTFFLFSVFFVVMHSVSRALLVIDGANVAASVTADSKTSSFSSPLMHIEGLLEALTVADKDGRIVIDKQG